MFADEISGDGIIVLDGQIVETVYYWLTVVPKAGPVIAEGSISGSEDVMKKIKDAKTAKLTSRMALLLRFDATAERTGLAG